MGKKKDKKTKKVKPKPIAKPKAQTKATKGKKKKWYTILSSKSFREAPIGECYVYEPSVLVGRYVNVNLMTLLQDFKKQNMSMSFKINKIRGDNALTEPYLLKMSPTALKRFVRRGRDRCDCNITITTSNKSKTLLKLIFLTRNNTSNSVLTALRSNANAFVEKYAKGKSIDNLMLEAVNGKLQKALKDAQKKIYPLRSCEVRILKVLDAGEPQAAPIVSEDEKQKIEENDQKEIKEEPKESKSKAKPDGAKKEAPKTKESKK